MGSDCISSWSLLIFFTFHQTIPFSSFSHFQNLELDKASTDGCYVNVILHFGLDLDNINVSAKFYQNIPNGMSYGNFCKLSWDKMFANCPGTDTLIIRHTPKVNLQLLLCR